MQSPVQKQASNLIWTPERIAAAAAEIERWKGTPHRDRMAKPGVGIDCIGYVCEITRAAGLIPAFTMPFYSPRWGIGRAFNVMERVLLKCFNVERITSPAEWRPGDLLIFKVGHQSNHIALLWQEGERFGLWHSRVRAGVEFCDMSAEIRKEAQAALRFTAPGLLLDPATLTPDDFKAWAAILGHHT